MSTDTSYLKLATQEYRISVDLLGPRNFRLADVWSDGEDTNRAFPPEDDPIETRPRMPYFEGITQIQPVNGSVRSGFWETTILVPRIGQFQDYFGVDLMAQTWHGGNPGVVGAAGIDRGRVRIFRGYMAARNTKEADDYDEGAYAVRSSAWLLQQSSLSRAIDFHAGSGSHHAPTTNAAIIDHLILQHTNFKPRSGYSVYLPDQSFADYTLGEGSIYAMLKSVADTVALDGWVYSTREDDLVISGHPNLVGPEIYGNGASSLSSPIMVLDDAMVMQWEWPELDQRQVASVMLNAVTSSQQELTAISYNDTGVGSRQRWPVTLRCDDQSFLNDMSGRLLKHLNRRLQGVKVQCPLNLAADSGDVILVTHKSRRPELNFTEKAFVVTDIEYNINTDDETWVTNYTIDEIVI